MSSAARGIKGGTNRNPMSVLGDFPAGGSGTFATAYRRAVLEKTAAAFSRLMRMSDPCMLLTVTDIHTAVMPMLRCWHVARN